jgi:hypothetical protein
LAIIALILILSAFMGLVFMVLWNLVVPPLFNGPTLDFWQAWAIWILIGIVGSAFRSVVSK